MTVFVVTWEKNEGYDGFSSGIDSVFSTAGLAMARCNEMAKVRPDLMWGWEELKVDDLLKE